MSKHMRSKRCNIFIVWRHKSLTRFTVQTIGSSKVYINCPIIFIRCTDSNIYRFILNNYLWMEQNKETICTSLKFVDLSYKEVFTDSNGWNYLWTFHIRHARIVVFNKRVVKRFLGAKCVSLPNRDPKYQLKILLAYNNFIYQAGEMYKVDHYTLHYEG